MSYPTTQDWQEQTVLLDEELDDMFERWALAHVDTCSCGAPFDEETTCRVCGATRTGIN